MQELKKHLLAEISDDDYEELALRAKALETVLYGKWKFVKEETKGSKKVKKYSGERKPKAKKNKKDKKVKFTEPVQTL